MPNCRFHKICAFFRNEMDYMPGTAGMYRKQYCMGRPAQCARCMVYTAQGPEAVPDNLFPYQQKRVEAILSDRQSA